MWDVEYDLPAVTDNDYGVDWPVGRDGARLSQVARELAGFRSPGTFGFGTRFEHGLRLLQMLLPDAITFYRDWEHYQSGEEVRIWNWYFMEVFKACCEEKRVALTGCASCSKTYGVAAYGLLAFMADPKNTTIMISTTAATDAERRVWGDIKEMHAQASRVMPIGTLLPYLTTITFDPKRELFDKRDVSVRDLGSGLMVIPIPQGSEGQKAIGKIAGTKNKNVIWIAEEATYMIDDFLRPESNLESNPNYQFICTGNANDPSDPHGKICCPDGGWGTIDRDCLSWRARGAKVLFLNGMKSPNMHPAVDPDEKDKEKLPFPYLMNRIAARNIAVRKGYGATEAEQYETGSKTRDFLQMAVGFWPGDSVDSTLLNREFVKGCRAHEPVDQWAGDDWTTVAGFDPAFSAGGDSNELVFGRLGRDKDGQTVLEIEAETVSISVEADTRVEFRTQVAQRVAAEAVKRKCKPENLFMDISGDGGLMAQELSRIWGTVEGISSLENDEDGDGFDGQNYHDVVTRLWFQVREAIQAGRVRGFNPDSRYAADLFTRRYEAVGKGVVKIEPKGKKGTGLNRVGYRQRMGRSPDAGDALVYLMEGAKRLGLPMHKESAEDARGRLISRFAPDGYDDREPYSQVTLEEASGDDPWVQSGW